MKNKVSSCLFVRSFVRSSSPSDFHSYGDGTIESDILSDDDCSSEFVPSELLTESAFGLTTGTPRTVEGAMIPMPLADADTTPSSEPCCAAAAVIGLMEIEEPGEAESSELLGLPVAGIAGEEEDAGGRRWRRQFGLKLGWRFACLLQGRERETKALHWGSPAETRGRKSDLLSKAVAVAWEGGDSYPAPRRL